MAKGNRIKVGLKCSESGDINYTTVKNSKTTTEKLELKKYCPRLKKHTIHKEALDSKSNGWGFESLLPCHQKVENGKNNKLY